jgi:hypothetical protein
LLPLAERTVGNRHELFAIKRSHATREERQTWLTRARRTVAREKAQPLVATSSITTPRNLLSKPIDHRQLARAGS